MTIGDTPPASGLREILAFTICTPHVDHAQRAYEQWLGYQLVESTHVTPEQGAAWNTPALIGQRVVALAPPESSHTVVRFVEQAAQPGFACMRQHGWNAVEILVRDPYELANEFSGSPFRVAVPPRPLPFDARIHAMQVWGPVGELLYFTSLPTDNAILDLSSARTRVDRPFIAILGGADASQMLDFYNSRLHTRTIAPQPVIVRIINETFALPDDHKIPLGIVKMPADYLIEVDQVPAGATARRVANGALPPGIAMVTFAVESLNAFDVPWHAAPRELSGRPYEGARVAVTRGVANEWLELVERPR
jgi:hypothetical protein